MRENLDTSNINTVASPVASQSLHLPVTQIEQLAWKLLKQNPNWRYGQAVFNAAYELFPSEADELRATPLDCFYKGENVAIFLETIQKIVFNTEPTVQECDARKAELKN